MKQEAIYGDLLLAIEKIRSIKLIIKMIERIYSTKMLTSKYKKRRKKIPQASKELVLAPEAAGGAPQCGSVPS